MATVITANIRNALSVTSCALRSVIDAIPRLLRHSDSGVALRSNEIAELRHYDALRREGVNAAIHGLGTRSVQAVLEELRLATMAAPRMC